MPDNYKKSSYAGQKKKLLTDIDKKKRQKMNNIVYKKQITDNVKKWEKRIYMFELR